MQIKDLLKIIFDAILEFGFCELEVNGRRKQVAEVNTPISTGQSFANGFRLVFDDDSFRELWLASDFDSISLPKCSDCQDECCNLSFNRCKICRQLNQEAKAVQPDLFNKPSKRINHG